MTELGVVFLPQFAPERLRSVAMTADSCGLDELWLWEDCFRQTGIASAASTLAWTDRLRVGIGLLPVPLRNVALTAMELATIERMFPARLHAGVGHGTQAWMGQVGARVESPLTLLGEYLSALRALLRGEELTTSGRYVHLDGVRLDWPPAAPLPVLAGAVGARTLRLSGELADGTILTAGTSPESVAAARAIIDAGRSAAGRDGAAQLTVYLLAATGDGAQERLARSRRDWGLDPDADVAVCGDAVCGDAEALAAAARRWANAGADTVVFQPTADDPDPERFVRVVAQDVRPLVPR
ncbi:MAG: LLM class flavin-dependent oxidoreductase [Mycobacteriales bacterium]|nr:MAG: LLM class flavin-dependent oxidoreductase [Pseudonocardiales bacterium]